MVLWMKVTMDKYELPMAVAGSTTELANMLGIKKTTIETSYYHSKKHRWRCCYKRVEIQDGEEDVA